MTVSTRQPRAGRLHSAGRVALALLLAGSGWAAQGRSGAERADLDEARRLIATGAAQEAAALLERTLASAPEDADALVLLGTARAILAQRSPSLDALRRAVALRPDSPAGHHALCMALARFGETEAARAACEAALELEPPLAGARVNLGLILAALDRLAEADEQLTRALEAEPDPETRAQALYLRGRLRRQQGRVEEAIRDLTEAVRLRPEQAAAWLELGLARVDTSSHESAIEALARAVALDPQSFEARYALGSQYLRGGDAGRAVPQLRAALRQRPDERDVVYGLGRALRATGASDEADELLRSLAERSRGRATSDADVREAGRLNNEGIELEAKGDHEAALERYRAAMAIHPRDPRFRKNVALTLCRLGRWAEAKAELREVLRVSPGDPDALKALYLALDHAPDAAPQQR
jgi:tetratricopeptide (TPR) repeat protein